MKSSTLVTFCKRRTVTGCDRVRTGRGGKEGSMVGQEQVAGELRAIRSDTRSWHQRGLVRAAYH